MQILSTRSIRRSARYLHDGTTPAALLSQRRRSLRRNSSRRYSIGLGRQRDSRRPYSPDATTAGNDDRTADGKLATTSDNASGPLAGNPVTPPERRARPQWCSCRKALDWPILASSVLFWSPGHPCACREMSTFHDLLRCYPMSDHRPNIGKRPRCGLRGARDIFIHLARLAASTPNRPSLIVNRAQPLICRV